MQFLLFTTEVAMAVIAESADIDGLIVDWEHKGKTLRQAGQDMEINLNTPADVARLAEATSLPITVRVNAIDTDTPREIALALDHGARSLMLPMSEHPREVESFLRLVDGRAQTVIQIETQPLAEQCGGLADLPWDHAYIGLHDLMISRGSESMWSAFEDGTVEDIFATLEGRSVGVGGITVLGAGRPIPFTALFLEMVRLGCGLSFLRRSFKHDLAGRDMGAEIRALRAFHDAASRRRPEAVEADRSRFYDVSLASLTNNT